MTEIGSQYLQFTFSDQGILPPKIKRNRNDLVTTPEEITKFLIDNEEFTGEILEPCCGNGRISRVLTNNGHSVISSDKYDYGFGEVKSLFEITKKYDNIITNPPFTQQQKVKKHLLNLTKRKLCLLWYVKNMGNEIESPSRKNLKNIYVFTEKIDWSETKLGWLFAWYVWDKEYEGNPQIKYISLKRAGNHSYTNKVDGGS